MVTTQGRDHCLAAIGLHLAFALYLVRVGNRRLAISGSIANGAQRIATLGRCYLAVITVGAKDWLVFCGDFGIDLPAPRLASAINQRLVTESGSLD